MKLPSDYKRYKQLRRDLEGLTNYDFLDRLSKPAKSISVADLSELPREIIVSAGTTTRFQIFAAKSLDGILR